MANWLLIIVGAAFQLAGALVVFRQVEVIREHEYGKPTLWTRLAAWVRRLLGRPKVVSGGGASLLCNFVMKCRGTARPAAAAPDATDAERIARLERYVEHIDRDIEAVHHAIDRETQQLTEAAERRDEELRQEVKRQEEQRLAGLRRPLCLQTLGACCVVVGVCFSAVGSVL